MTVEGRDIFRFDTFGSEAFWGDTLGLHETIKTVVSPAVALELGLKVDVEALPGSIRNALASGTLDLDDPANTVALLQNNAVVGLQGVFEGDELTSVGITCALCHSTVNNSFAPSIGSRLDGWANRDLNVGAVIASVPNLQPVVDLLRNAPSLSTLTEEQLRQVLLTWGPGRFDAQVLHDGKAINPETGEVSAHAYTSGFRACRGELAHLHRLRLGSLLERLRRRHRDAGTGDVLRSAAERSREVSDRCRYRPLEHPQQS